MNFLDELSRHFRKPLHLFNFIRAYDSICVDRYCVQRVQSVKDVADANDFSNKYNCNLFLVEIPDELGMIAVIKQRQKENYLFADIISKNVVFKTPICVN